MSGCLRRSLARKLGQVAVLSVCLAMAACATVTAPPAEPPLPIGQWSSSELINSMAQRRERFRSLRSLARVDYAGPDGKGNVQEAVLVKRPDRLRLETLTFLGAVLIVTVDNNEIVGYHPREGIFVRGERTKDNLLRYTQIPLELSEITALLMGLAPLEGADLLRQEGNTLVFSYSGGKQDAVTFNSPMPVPSQWQRFNADGGMELTARYLDYVSTPAGLFPLRIQIEAPLQKRNLEIRYQEPELNPSIPEELFSQQKPGHAQELRLESLGG